MQHMGYSALSCTLQPSGVLGYTDLILELEFEVMGLNWAVGLPGHVAGIFAACIYLVECPFLLI